jgi:hypothetical protein
MKKKLSYGKSRDTFTWLFDLPSNVFSKQYASMQYHANKWSFTTTGIRDFVGISSWRIGILLIYAL